MKNIHVFPTDGSTRLHFDDKLFLSTNLQISKDINSIVEGRNIYITSNEEINSGDWFLTDDKRVEKSLGDWRAREWHKKIILTTDQDLIKDGVQPIDDEFLEWFVKNPSCEEVLVANGWGLEVDIETPYYKIIIPKEEQTTEEQLPTKWFKTEEIETWIGESITADKPIEEIQGGRGKLIVLHQCGENKEELISQLETMIYGLKDGFESFAQ